MLYKLYEIEDKDFLDTLIKKILSNKKAEKNMKEYLHQFSPKLNMDYPEKSDKEFEDWEHYFLTHLISSYFFAILDEVDVYEYEKDDISCYFVDKDYSEKILKKIIVDIDELDEICLDMISDILKKL